MKPIQTLVPVALLAMLMTSTLTLSSHADPSNNAAQQSIANPSPELSHKQYKRHYKHMTPEEREAKRAEWAKKHPEKAVEWQKKKEAFNQQHPEYAAQKEQWKTLSHDERKAKRKAWLAEHPEEAKAIKADYKAMRAECRASHKGHKCKATQAQ